jgi:hypothetical protein
MAANKAHDAGRAFLARLLEHVPAEARADVQKHLESERILELAGTETLARADYSRNMNTLRQNQTALDQWFEKHKPVLELGLQAQQRAAQPRGARREDPNLDLNDDDDELDLTGRRRPAPPAVDTSRFVDRDEAIAQVRQLEGNAMKFASMLSRISMAHYKEFGGEILDPDKLVEHAEATGLRLDLAYNDYVAERRESARQADLDARLKAAREEGIAQGKASAATELPWPVGHGEVRPLLPTEADRSNIGLAAALRTFHEESAKVPVGG